MRSCSTALLLALGASVTHAFDCDLVISEFINRAAGNDGLEVANPCGSAVDGTDYFLEFYDTSLYTPTRVVALGATLTNLPANEVKTVFSVLDSSLVPAQPVNPLDVTPNFEIPIGDAVFQGTEAILLKNKQGVIIDSLGQIGAAANWGQSAGRRRSTTALAFPDRNPYDAFVFRTPQWLGATVPAIDITGFVNPPFTPGSKHAGKFYVKWPQGKCVDDGLSGEQIDATVATFDTKILCCNARCATYPAASVCHDRCLEKPSDATYDSGAGRCLAGTSNPPVGVFPQCLLTVTGASAAIMPLFQVPSLPVAGNHRIACCQDYLPSQSDFDACMARTGAWHFVQGRGCVLHDGKALDPLTTAPRFATTARSCGTKYFPAPVAKFCDAVVCDVGTVVNAAVHCGTHLDDCTKERCCHRKCSTSTAYSCPVGQTLIPDGDCGRSIAGCNDDVCCQGID